MYLFIKCSDRHCLANDFVVTYSDFCSLSLAPCFTSRFVSTLYTSRPGSRARLTRSVARAIPALWSNYYTQLVFTSCSTPSNRSNIGSMGDLVIHARHNMHNNVPNDLSSCGYAICAHYALILFGSDQEQFGILTKPKRKRNVE
jgi:hypothetical protein